MDAEVRRASHRGQAGPAAHPEMAGRGSYRGRRVVGKRGGSPAGGDDFGLLCWIRGHDQVIARPGRGGHMPPRSSMARATSASGERNPKAMRVRSRSLVFTLSTRALDSPWAVSYTHLRAHETVLDLVCRLLLEKKKRQN